MALVSADDSGDSGMYYYCNATFTHIHIDVAMDLDMHHTCTLMNTVCHVGGRFDACSSSVVTCSCFNWATTKAVASHNYSVHLPALSLCVPKSKRKYTVLYISTKRQPKVRTPLQTVGHKDAPPPTQKAKM